MKTVLPGNRKTFRAPVEPLHAAHTGGITYHLGRFVTFAMGCLRISKAGVEASAEKARGAGDMIPLARRYQRAAHTRKFRSRKVAFRARPEDHSAPLLSL